MQQDTTDQDCRSASPPVAAGAVPRPYLVRCCDAVPTALAPNVLACIAHGLAVDDGDPRRIDVQLPALRGPAVEIWESPRPVRWGVDHGICYAENGEALFGHVFLPESDLDGVDRAVFHSYALLDGFLRRHGYPAWLRVWNFMARINHGEADHERYRQFSLGRYKALALKPGFERELPAATAIGTHGDGLLVYFLAGRVPGVQIENPRQVSAFHYPRQYGPRSPSFSRAMYMPWLDVPELLVSGTASVVGHQTLHEGDPDRQLDETLANLDALLRHTTVTGKLGDRGRWQPEQVKLYLRDPQLLDRVWPTLSRAFDAGTPLLALHGDVCRSDLDLEIEALYQYTPP